MRLDHVGIAVSELAAANDLFARLLGREHYKIEEVIEQGVNTSFLRALAADAKIELVAGSRPGNPIEKYIGKRGSGLHHLAFEVDDIEAEMRRLAADGFELLNDQPQLGADNKLICFLHPRSTCGVLIEICQSIAKDEK